MKTPFLQSAALQPGVARKAKICHTKTVNIDLICSDGAQRALEMSTRIAEGALQAAASDDNVLRPAVDVRPGGEEQLGVET